MMDLIDAVVYCFIDGLCTLRHKNLTAKLLGLLAACERGELFYQFFAFLLGNKATALHGVNQQLQFRQFKLPFSYVIPDRLAALHFNINAKLP
ncbi:hypothetical protein SDC9_196572 [bioreactor metagenome]|uniref:Uncharacterized protein n=1 Tax=bioreactor metagenome TaxID=1076179 RepID=A0A645IER9_9ZZZZ